MSKRGSQLYAKNNKNMGIGWRNKKRLDIKKKGRGIKPKKKQ